jgi:hypothetical protein
LHIVRALRLDVPAKYGKSFFRDPHLVFPWPV